MNRARPTATSTAVRDQILAALNAAYPLPLTTREIADRLPPLVVKIRSDCQSMGCESVDMWTSKYRILECHHLWHVGLRRRKSSDVHRHLLALARTGAVIRPGHNRQATQSEPWTVEPNAASLRELADLEQAWTDL